MYLQLQGKQKRFPHSYFCHFWNLNYFSNKIYIKKCSFSCILDRSMASTIPIQIYMKSGVSFLYFKHFPTQKAILQMQRYKLGFFKLFFVFFVFYFLFFLFHLSIFFMYLWLCQPLLLSLCDLHLFDEIFHLFSPFFLHF